MSDQFKKKIEELYKKELLSEFEYGQLVCLNSMMSSLLGIESNLEGVTISLNKISDKLENIAVK